MKQTKLYIVLTSFSKEEWKSLQRYIVMSTSESSTALKLFHYLYDCHKKNKEPLSKEETRTLLFPQMATKRFLNLCSSVYLICEEWLVWQEIKKDKSLCNVHLVKTYNRRGIFELADKTFTRSVKKLKQQKTSDLEKNEYLSKIYKYHYFSENPVKHREDKALLEDMVTYSAQSYLEQTQLYIAELYNWGRARNFDYSISQKMLLESIRGIPISESSKITHLIYKMVSNNDQESMMDLYQLLINNKIRKGSDLETFATLYLTYYSRGLGTKGKLKNLDLLSKIHDYGLSSQILMNLGKLTPFRFIDIVSVLVLTTKTKDLYAFIEKWIHLVYPSQKVAVESLAKCYVKREEGKFEDIILLLRGLHFPNYNLTNIGLSFQIMAFYKLQEYELALNVINNFKRRLRKVKSTSDKNKYLGKLNFLIVMEKLIKKEHSNITIDLNKYPFLYHKRWLSKQI